MHELIDQFAHFVKVRARDRAQKLIKSLTLYTYSFLSIMFTMLYEMSLLPQICLLVLHPDRRRRVNKKNLVNVKRRNIICSRGRERVFWKNGGIFLSSKLQGNIRGNPRMVRSAFSMTIERESKRELWDPARFYIYNGFLIFGTFSNR